MHRPDQLGHDGEQIRDAVEERFQRAFGADGGAGDQVDRDAGPGTQPEDRSHGIFLRAPDDKPGDDMGDAHPRVREWGMFSTA